MIDLFKWFFCAVGIGVNLIAINQIKPDLWVGLGGSFGTLLFFWKKWENLTKVINFIGS